MAPNYLPAQEPLLQLSAFLMLILFKNDYFKRAPYNQMTSTLSGTSIIQRRDPQLILYSSSETLSKYKHAGKIIVGVENLYKLSTRGRQLQLQLGKKEKYTLPGTLLRWPATRNRHIRELVYRREDRADEEAMMEAARQAYRERQRLQEARQEAALQGLRRSERGRIPKRNREH